jgi:murein DD-endopeptidase MepM/ murein hydrolase activator NlpD
MAPHTRYAMVVTTAVVGAGVVAFGAGSALPQQGDGATAALDKKNASQQSDVQTLTDASASQARSATVGRASRAQSRSGMPAPTIQPVWLRPAIGPLSSMFGPRWGTVHKGLDIAAPFGSTVHAASAGTVVRAGWFGGYGNVIIIDHGNGLESRYGHNSKVLVKAGDHVEAGTPISLVGSTGYSTGPHCHFEIRINDVPRDPLSWMKARGVDLTHWTNVSITSP